MNNNKNSKIMNLNNNKSYKSYNVRRTPYKTDPIIKLWMYIALFGFFIGMMVLLIISINKNITEITDDTTLTECKGTVFELYNSQYCGKDNFKKSKLIGYSVLILLFFIFVILFLIGIISTIINIRKQKHTI